MNDQSEINNNNKKNEKKTRYKIARKKNQNNKLIVSRTHTQTQHTHINKQ